MTPAKRVHFETAPSLVELMEKKGIENLRYYSPEQMDGQISLKSDIWAFACVILEFVTGQQPYDGMSDDL
jgi:serine/threonine protein kinase